MADRAQVPVLEAGLAQAVAADLNLQTEQAKSSFAIDVSDADFGEKPTWILRKSCLARDLERWHITGAGPFLPVHLSSDFLGIAFAGTIGAGLFIYMSEIIGIVGSPGAMVSYCLTGFIVVWGLLLT